MKIFMDENFLLNNMTAVKLYHEYAKDMPIFDYHCHLNPKDIAENKKFRNITELWLGGDHYKWRALRSNGVEEKYITGDAGDKEKFFKWAETMPKCLGNPLYHWTHLELRRYFGIYDLLSPKTAGEIWDKCNKSLDMNEFRARALVKRSNVKLICTTDDPADTLEYHKIIADDKTFDVKVLPTFRPDKGIYIERDGFHEWMKRLGQAAGVEISSLDDLKSALKFRIDFFHSMGCRISDHSLEPVVYAEANAAEDVGTEADLILKKALNRHTLTEGEVKLYKTQVLIFLGREYARRGWVMQFHMGTIRNNNKRMLKMLGPDTGFDAIGDYSYANDLAYILNKLDETGELPKTILYCLNPKDNDILASIIGCFQDGSIPGKLQFGSGWWFNDQKDGIIRQMTALANHGLLSRFIGMLTDSRSFISYTRHEYFRRILCNLVGEWVESGEAPGEYELLEELIKGICYNNAKNYFDIEL